MQDLIAEDMVPLREIGLKEIEEKIAEDTVSWRWLVGSKLKSLTVLQRRRDRDFVIKGKVLGAMGFDREGREGDAY
jgi:hypothetical protein